MPGSMKWRGEMLVQAVGVNKVPQNVLDERAQNVLTLVNRCALAKIPKVCGRKVCSYTKDCCSMEEDWSKFYCTAAKRRRYSAFEEK